MDYEDRDSTARARKFYFDWELKRQYFTLALRYCKFFVTKLTDVTRIYFRVKKNF